MKWKVTDADSGVNPATIGITIDSGSKVTGDSITKTAVTGGYECTYTPTTALADGSHTIKIDASDFDGNAATQKTVTFKIDTVPPTLSITAPAINWLPTRLRLLLPVLPMTQLPALLVTVKRTVVLRNSNSRI
ncbi:MAG: Ig-like domain-containing protein [Clostridium sp.]